MNEDKALKPGTVINGNLHEYTIADVIASDSQGYTYRATVTVAPPKGAKAKSPATATLVIREHFMGYCSDRGPDGIEVVTPEDIAPTVEACLDSFRKSSELRQSISTSHSAIINVLECFDANNTHYYVVEYLTGVSFDEYVRQRGSLSFEEASKILSPIFYAALHIHRHGALHTDIHPGHIRFTTHNNTDTPVLFSLYNSLHFDEGGHKLWSVPDTTCRTGFAPPEQYREIDFFAPQVDIYALGATLLFALTGKPLPDSRTLTRDSIRELIPASLPETQAAALLHALEPEMSERTLSVTGFFEDLNMNADNHIRGERRASDMNIDTQDDGSAPSYFAKRMVTMLLMAVAAVAALIVLLTKLF